jgi:two-component system phosphate regulon sensor histidine kinase PhoR
MLVQDVLTLSQIESGDIKMHQEYFDIRKLVEEVFDQLVERADKRNITLKLEPEKGSYLVFADYQRIHQVIVNLVQNGMKYNKEGGTVKVLIAGNNSRISIVVSDDGEGIDPKHHQRIFERFYRVEKSRARSKGGTGLGLAIVQHILEGHKTRIRVRSKLGEGAEFSFDLPIDKS